VAEHRPLPADGPEPRRILGRHRALLSDPLIRSWWEARSLRSRLSADTSLRHVGLFVERLHRSPRELLAFARQNPDRLRDLLVAYAKSQKDEGRLDSYILKTFEGLKSWFKHHRVRFDEFPSLSPIRGASLAKERVPTPQELGQVLERLTLRGRVIALFLAHSGVRPAVLGSYGGEAGLTLGDLPELDLGRRLQFRELPFVVKVPAALSKTRQQYVTFGTEQLASTLLAYLSFRREHGENLRPTSPVVAPGSMRGAAAKSRADARVHRAFIATKNVVEEVRDALHATVPEGVTWRPYVLRSYCSTRLLLAEGQGLISRDLREALLGHDGGIASRYNVGKRWGEELLVEARREYARAASFLETGRSREETDLLQQTKALILEAVGLDPTEAAKFAAQSKEEVLAEVRRRLGATSAGPSGTTREAAPTTADRLVSVVDAERLLGAGWTWLGSVGDRVAVRGPA
jgi:hypothetical protein